MRQALIEKNAVEIVKQMQRLKGLDDDYDSDSAASNRLQTRSVVVIVILIHILAVDISPLKRKKT